MKAILTDGFGGAGVLRWADAPVPEPGPGQVLVEVVATSVNRADVVQREGKYPPPPGESEILGLEAAGVVREAGPGVERFRAGDRVMALVAGGGYAEFACAYEDHLVRVPETLSWEEAACVCETYVTAYLNLFMLGGLGDRDAVLLHGGGGGVGTAAIHLCRTLVPDARVVATCSTGKVERVRATGAHLVVDYTAGEFAPKVRAFTGGRGVDVVLDHVGAAYLKANLKAMAPGGRLIVIGLVGGFQAELDLALLMVKRHAVVGSVLRSRPVAEKARIVAEFERVAMPHVAERRIVPLIDAVYPLREAAEAHRRMEASAHFGKLVLRVRGDPAR